MITEIQADSWNPVYEKNSESAILHNLEQGNVIFLPRLNFVLANTEKKFLTPDCADPKSKNISYDCQTSVVQGTLCMGHDLTQLQALLMNFAQHSRTLVDCLFPHYQQSLQWGRTSFRPMAIESRRVGSYRKDDTRLHVDSFASRPVKGLRLLRVFSNIHPSLPRLWKLGEPFDNVAERFLPHIRPKQWLSPFLLDMLGITKGLRSAYDHIMLQIHNKMKGDMDYQKTVPQREFSFPAGTSWVVMTDKVSHAALAGQFVLEQTFYLPVEAMSNPELSPLRILEKKTGKILV